MMELSRQEIASNSYPQETRITSVLHMQSGSPEAKQKPLSQKGRALSTYIDVTLLVALVEVKQDGSFMQIA